MAAQEVQRSKKLNKTINKAVEKATVKIEGLQALIRRPGCSEFLQKQYARAIGQEEFNIRRLQMIGSTLKAEIDHTVIGYVSALAADQIGDLRDRRNGEFEDASDAINDIREEQWENEDKAAADAVDHKDVDIDRIINEAMATTGPNMRSDDPPVAAAPAPTPVVARHARRPSVPHVAPVSQVVEIEQQLDRLLPRMDDLPRLTEDEGRPGRGGGGSNGPLPVPVRDQQQQQQPQRARSVMPSFLQ